MITPPQGLYLSHSCKISGDQGQIFLLDVPGKGLLIQPAGVGQEMRERKGTGGRVELGTSEKGHGSLVSGNGCQLNIVENWVWRALSLVPGAPV